MDQSRRGPSKKVGKAKQPAVKQMDHAVWADPGLSSQTLMVLQKLSWSKFSILAADPRVLHGTT